MQTPSSLGMAAPTPSLPVPAPLPPLRPPAHLSHLSNPLCSQHRKGVNPATPKTEGPRRPLTSMVPRPHQAEGHLGEPWGRSSHSSSAGQWPLCPWCHAPMSWAHTSSGCRLPRLPPACTSCPLPRELHHAPATTPEQLPPTRSRHHHGRARRTHPEPHIPAARGHVLPETRTAC